jgi:single-strand DNA-binding protein
MRSVNKVILLGNLGQAPETRALKNGTLLTTASLATSERFKQGEEWKDRTEWHSVIFYGKLAEIARDYLRKGSKVYIEGRIRTDSWTDDKTGTKHWRTHVVVSDVTLLDSRDSRPPQTPDYALSADNYGYGSSAKAATTPSISDEYIPF